MLFVSNVNFKSEYYVKSVCSARKGINHLFGASSYTRKKKKASESLAIIHCHIHFSLNSEDEKIEHLGRELSLSWSLDEHNVGMELFFSVFNIINCFFKTGRFAPGIKKCR